MQATQGGLQMTFRTDHPWIMNVIRLPKVTPKDAAQAQWSHTLPLDFAETLPTAISLTEDQSPKVDEPPVTSSDDGTATDDFTDAEALRIFSDAARIEGL
jgi:hypothetical protein